MIEYLEEHNPKRYAGMEMSKEFRSVENAIHSSASVVLLWENPEAETSTWNGPVDYSLLKEPNMVGPRLETTVAQRQRILEYNKKMNNGLLRSDIDGTILDMPANVPKGGKANMNQAEVDHIVERVNNGSNSNSNLRVISKQQNLDKEVIRKASN